LAEKDRYSDKNRDRDRDRDRDHDSTWTETAQEIGYDIYAYKDKMTTYP